MFTSTRRAALSLRRFCSLLAAPDERICRG
jgi:hypothetical protein